MRFAYKNKKTTPFRRFTEKGFNNYYFFISYFLSLILAAEGGAFYLSIHSWSIPVGAEEKTRNPFSVLKLNAARANASISV